MPIENQVVDRNADGQITDDDRYFYKSPWAPVTMGLGSRLEWKNWDFGFNMRASIGNYVYNDNYASRVNLTELYYGGYMQNTFNDAVSLDWRNAEWVQSDYFVHNASFLKLDNVTLGYSFANLFKTGKWQGMSGRVYGTVNNVFTITKYKGLDPEVNTTLYGVDYEIYPRSRSFMLGLNLNF
jgi:iron complex outermembrane receptor protein